MQSDVGGQNVKMTKIYIFGEEYCIYDHFDSKRQLGKQSSITKSIEFFSKHCVLCGSPIICTNKKQPPNKSHIQTLDNPLELMKKSPHRGSLVMITTRGLNHNG